METAKRKRGRPRKWPIENIDVIDNEGRPFCPICDCLMVERYCSIDGQRHVYLGCVYSCGYNRQPILWHQGITRIDIPGYVDLAYRKWGQRIYDWWSQ